MNHPYSQSDYLFLLLTSSECIIHLYMYLNLLFRTKTGINGIFKCFICPKEVLVNSFVYWIYQCVYFNIFTQWLDVKQSTSDNLLFLAVVYLCLLCVGCSLIKKMLFELLSHSKCCTKSWVHMFRCRNSCT